MKKFITTLLAVVMVISMALPAFAENTSLIINDNGDRDYVGYKLLNLTTSLKTDSHHDAHDGEHTSDCYNYAYTVNEKYRTILQTEVFNNGGNYLWEGITKPADATGVTDDQILKYLANQISDNGDVYSTMRVVADRLYIAITTAALAADAENLTGEGDAIEQGYWIFADVTDLDGEGEANSLVMVDTKGQDELVITSKTALPTVEKKVKDIDDSEDDNILDNAWHDTADHDIGDIIEKNNFSCELNLVDIKSAREGVYIDNGVKLALLQYILLFFRAEILVAGHRVLVLHKGEVVRQSLNNGNDRVAVCCAGSADSCLRKLSFEGENGDHVFH